MTITVDTVAEFVGRATSPLVERLSDDASITEFVAELGWTLPSVPTGVFSGLRTAALNLRKALGDLTLARVNGSDTAAAAASVTLSFAALVAELDDLQTALESSDLGDTFLQESGIAPALGRRILDFLLIKAIGSASQMARGVLVALGLIEETDLDPNDGAHQPAFTLRQVRLDRAQQLFGGIRDLLADVYGWGTPTLKAERLYRTINELSFGLITPVSLAFPSQAFLSSVFPQLAPDATVDSMLNFPVAHAGSSSLDVAILPAPKVTPDEQQGLAFRLIGAPAGTFAFGIGSGLQLTLDVRAALDTGIGVVIRPDGDPDLLVGVEGTAGPLLQGGVSLVLHRDTATPLTVLTFPTGGGLDVSGYQVALELQANPAEISVSGGVQGGKVTFSLSEADGFIGSVVPASSVSVNFDLGLGWSSLRGIFLTGSGGLETDLAINQSLGPVLLKAIHLALRADGSGLRVAAGASAAVTLGPVVASVDGIGVAALLRFEPGNLGPMDLDAEFVPPTGLGIAVNAGPVHGGGFISFDPTAGRYSGALELSIYDISVKAFGLIETKVPGVSFSFVIVISAEFTPIQLGFGFTLNGVGGLVGINRTVNSNELGRLVREGRSEELLFPKNLIANAPTIIRDLGAVFPARQSHYVFGPLGKLGWGTPTLITGEIGIIIEIPGVVVILGEIKVLLPKPEVPLVKMNMSVGGTLDFPNKTFSLDAALHDSIIEGYPISGQMALRVKWGEQPNFVASIGGFHPAYQPPKDFPKLQPMTLDLGQHGSASITVSGFFAVTSNTVQVGGDARLHAGGSGISLDASVSVKALFVFAPFHFEATIDASVKISFHGYGPSVHLSGVLEGPSPWHIKGELCVSIVFWDACLGFDETFGGTDTAGVPELDPWDPASPDIVGLHAALVEAGNWSGTAPAGTAAVVSRAQGAEKLVDPVGGLQVHQKAVPVETDQPISRFGVAKVTSPTKYVLQGATFGTGTSPPALTVVSKVNDFFAPAQYFQMDDGKKLSAAGFEQMQAGYVFGENNANLRQGSNNGVQSNYQTYIIGGDGTISGPQVDQATQAQVAGQNKRSAVAVGGVTQLGTRRFIDRLITQAFEIRPPTFILTNNTSLAAISSGQSPVSRTSALLSMDAYRLQNQEQKLLVQVSALHELAT